MSESPICTLYDENAEAQQLSCIVLEFFTRSFPTMRLEKGKMLQIERHERIE